MKFGIPFFISIKIALKLLNFYKLITDTTGVVKG